MSPANPGCVRFVARSIERHSGDAAALSQQLLLSLEVGLAPRVCVGPIRYIGHEKLQRDIRNLKAAMAAAGADEGFSIAVIEP